MTVQLPVEPGERIRLPRQGGLPEMSHVFEEPAIWAVNAALAADRPLLIRGEPGAGKSQLARAAAAALRWPFVYDVITARTECQDLLWRFDAVARLAKAQVLGSLGPEAARRVEDELSECRFLAPECLWWAINWESARAHVERWHVACNVPDAPPAWQPDEHRGCILLIDEIDKADTDVPNGLLEALGNGSFQVPYLPQAVRCVDTHQRPLVMITTNEERDLPPAFVRRCLVLTLSLPSDEADLIEWLMARGEAHFGDECAEPVRREAARLLARDRRDALSQGQVAPGQAEYLDLLRAVIHLAGEGLAPEERESAQREVLDRVATFALKKGPLEPFA